MNHDDRSDFPDEDDSALRHRDDSALRHRMEEEANSLIQMMWEPPTDEQAFDDSISKWTNSQDFIDHVRIARVAEILNSLVKRLDNYKCVDDLWRFFTVPEKARPELRPPLSERWATATVHLLRMLIDIGRAKRDAVRFQDDRNIQVCLRALDKEIKSKHCEYTALAENGARYAEAIVVIKRTLRLARLMLRRTLVLLAASAELTAEEKRKDALPKYFPDHFIAGQETDEGPKKREPPEERAKRQILKLREEGLDFMTAKPDAIARGVKKVRRATTLAVIRKLKEKERSAAEPVATGSRGSGISRGSGNHK